MSIKSCSIVIDPSLSWDDNISQNENNTIVLTKNDIDTELVLYNANTYISFVDSIDRNIYAFAINTDTSTGRDNPTDTIRNDEEVNDIIYIWIW